jgi:hypothetical protein
MECEEKTLEEIDTFPDLLNHFKKCLKAKRVKERADDLGYFFMEAINEVLPKKCVKKESPETIEAIKKEWGKILQNAQRAIWRERKRGDKEFNYGGDPQKFIEKLDDTEWGINIKTRVRLPSNTLFSQKIKHLTSGEYGEESFLSEIEDSEILNKINLIEKDARVRELIDDEGGEFTANIFKLLIQYSPYKISAKTISEKIGISHRTVERRIAWIKKNEENIHRIIERNLN